MLAGSAAGVGTGSRRSRWNVEPNASIFTRYGIVYIQVPSSVGGDEQCDGTHLLRPVCRTWSERKDSRFSSVGNLAVAMMVVVLNGH